MIPLSERLHLELVKRFLIPSLNLPFFFPAHTHTGHSHKSRTTVTRNRDGMSTVVSLQTHSGITQYRNATLVTGHHLCCNYGAFGMKMVQESWTNTVKMIGNEVHGTK